MMVRLNGTNGTITNENLRRQCFANRKKNLMKKVHELSTLCDVKVGMILYEGEGNFDIAPQIHPDPHTIKHLINKYTEQPRGSCKRRNTNSSSVVKSRISKAEVDIANLQESMMGKRPTSPPLFSRPSFDGNNLEDLSQGQLAEFRKLIDEKIENVSKAYDSKKKKSNVGNTRAPRRRHIIDINTEAVAPRLHILDMTDKPQAAPQPRMQSPPTKAVQKTWFNHLSDHPMHNWPYNMQVGTLSQHQQHQIMMPFVFPHNVGFPNPHQVSETSSFSTRYYNQMELKPEASVGQYAMWYPPVNLKPVLPYMQYYHGMISNGDSAKWGMEYPPERNFGPNNLPPKQ